MKNLLKILLVVVALVVVGCTTDTTEDLTVSIDNGNGQTTIAFSLEESRTQLGEKADGVYPLYWSEGDQVAVNGVASTALTASEAGSSVTAFSFGSKLEYPYNVVYPAPAEGVTPATEGLQVVTFLAAQSYVEGTFCSGAAPMYGYATAPAEGDETHSIQLNHLAGVLRFAPIGEGVTLTSLTVQSENGSIAGNFDLDCTNGTLTAHDNATNQVTLSFGEGLKLGAEATPIYVAVPAGSYGTFVITLHTANDKMTVKFDSDAKPVNAGTVREFAPFTYAANEGDGEVFVIATKEDLIKFASIASNFYPHKKAQVTANIDMTGVEWSPIVGFGAHTFDGGNFEIKGLTAPLFEETSAAIENVKLVDVNITETVKPNVGAIAREMPLVEGVTALTNCSASGKIVVNCENVPSLDFVCAIGGLLGSCEQGMVISGCTNSVNVDVQSVTTAEATKKNFYIGGVVGYNKSHVKECTNNGSVTVASLSTTGDLMLGGIVGSVICAKNSTNSGTITVKGSHVGRVFVGGAFGYSMSTEVNKCVDCVNSGAINIDKGAEFSKEAYIGGMAGCTKFSVENCTNSGDISIAGTYNGNTYIAGNTAWVFATSGTNKIVGADNSGDITITGDAVFAKIGNAPASYATAVNADNMNPMIAGCVATGNTAVDSSDNSGNITIEAGEQLKSGYLIAGIVTNTAKWVTNSENSGNIEFKEGAIVANNGFISGGVAVSTGQGVKNITNRGAISFYGTNAYRLFIGGCLGQSLLAATGAGKEIFADLNNYGPITLKGTMEGESASTNVGGVICYIKGDATRLYNYEEAAITIAHKAASSNFVVGGIVTDADSHLTDAENHAAIDISGPTAGDGYNAFVGGVVAHHANVSNRTNCSNSGDISFSTTSTPTSIAIGGVFMSGIRLNCKNCHNSGDITVGKFGLVSSNENANMVCGGVIGRIMDAGQHVTLSNCTNSGDISVDGSNCGGSVYVGGIFANMASSATTLQVVGDATNNNIGIANSGNITVTGSGKTLNSANSWLLVGGVFGHSNKEFAPSGKEWSGIVKNTGAVNVTSLQNQSIYMGGLVGLINNTKAGATLTGSTFVNTGNVTCSGVVPTAHYIGGIVGLIKTNVVGASSYCDIEAIGFSKMGMITGTSRSETVVASNCMLGGTICNKQIKDVSAEGDEVLEKQIITLGESSNIADAEEEAIAVNDYWYNYIYGEAVAKATAEADGCSFLSVKPTL